MLQMMNAHSADVVSYILYTLAKQSWETDGQKILGRVNYSKQERNRSGGVDSLGSVG